MDCQLDRSVSTWRNAGAHGQPSVRRRSPYRGIAPMGWLAVVFLVSTTGGADGAESPANAAVSPTSPNQEAVVWLDCFALDQVLFHDHDIAQIRRKMVDSPPAEAQQWLDETAAVRRKLDSPEWQATRTWLRRLLKVQAIHTEEEVNEFHQSVMAATPAELGKMMQEIEDRRLALVSKASNAAQRRQQMMVINGASKRKQFAQRQAIRHAASQGADFATTKNTKVKGKPSYATRSVLRAPLISSLGVARWAVYRSMWSRW